MRYIVIPTNDATAKEILMIAESAKYNKSIELVEYAKTIQSNMSDADFPIPWTDALEMSFNELIIPILDNND